MRSHVAFIVLLLIAWLAVVETAGAKPPNVLLIISDDQAWTDFGFMGHEVIATPHLDRLAAEGATFTRGYVPTSLCRASLASIISGRYAHEHRITSNDPPRGTDRSLMLRHMSGLATLPRLLAPLGYQSLQTGKWWEGHFALGGFTHGMTHGDPARRGRHGDEGLRIGREGLEPIFDFIELCGERPFFIWYAPLLPHEPHNPPERLLAKYTTDSRPPALARYWAMCEWFDETVGELLEFLDQRGLSDDTLVAFVVDNGWIQEVGPERTTRGRFAPKSKLSPYDGGTRTPIILRWPGHISPARYDVPVSSLDLMPTILEACGTDPPESLPGISLFDVREGQSPPARPIFGELFSHDAVDIDDPAANLASRWCVDGRWKLIVHQNRGQPAELYDLGDDPHETKNLAAGHPEEVERLRTMIQAWWPAE